jgi:hypothetical protein
MSDPIRVPLHVVEAAAKANCPDVQTWEVQRESRMDDAGVIIEGALVEWGFEIERDDPLEPPPQPYRLIGPWEGGSGEAA